MVSCFLKAHSIIIQRVCRFNYKQFDRVVEKSDDLRNYKEGKKKLFLPYIKNLNAFFVVKKNACIGLTQDIRTNREKKKNIISDKHAHFVTDRDKILLLETHF